MSYTLLGAAVLLFGVGLAHSYFGERLILVRLFRRDNLPRLGESADFTKRVLRFAWHLTTIAWFGLAAVLVVLAREIGDAPESGVLASGTRSLEQSIGWAIAVTFAASAVVTAAASRLRHPAWPVFAAIAVLTWIGV